jgi:hypothetical protein
MRKVVTQLSAECLFERMTEAFGEMLGGRRDNEPLTPVCLPGHDPANRIIDGCAVGLVVEQSYYLGAMGRQESAIKVDEAGRNPFLPLLTGGANLDPRRMPLSALAALLWRASQSPSPSGVDRTA